MNLITFKCILLFYPDHKTWSGEKCLNALCGNNCRSSKVLNRPPTLQFTTATFCFTMLNSRVLASRWSKNVPFLREAVRFAHNTVDVASGSDLPQLPRLNNKKLFSDNTKRAQFTRRPREKNENDYSEMSSSTFTPRRERIRYKEKLSNERVIRPAVQSSRVRELMDSGDFDTAVKLLTESKPDTLNVPVYNTVIHGFMRAGKRKEAYRIFIDVRSIPNARY